MGFEQKATGAESMSVARKTLGREVIEGIVWGLQRQEWQLEI